MLTVAPELLVTLATTSRAIRAKLRGGFVVECLGPGCTWHRIGRVRYNESGFNGLRVQEFSGLKAWFTPKSSRCYRQGVR